MIKRLIWGKSHEQVGFSEAFTYTSGAQTCLRNCAEGRCKSLPEVGKGL